MLAGRAQLDDFDPFAKQPKMSYKVRSALSTPGSLRLIRDRA